jgi:hypothetical protein
MDWTKCEATRTQGYGTITIHGYVTGDGTDTPDAWRCAVASDRCSDGNYYVVKFQNNPQHPRVLVNEMLGTRLASRLGLPTTPAAVIEVSEELIQLTPDLCIERPRQRIPCRPGKQFGSRYPGDPADLRYWISCQIHSWNESRTCTSLPECWFLTNGPATPTAGRLFFVAKHGKVRIHRTRPS